MKKYFLDLRLKITKYSIIKLQQWYIQINKLGVKSETVSYFYSDSKQEFVLDTIGEIWPTTPDQNLAKEVIRNKYNGLILDLYNFGKSDEEKLRWKTLVRLYDAKFGINANITVNQNVGEEISLADLDNLSMDKM